MKKFVDQMNKKLIFILGSVALAIVLLSVIFVIQTSSQYQLHADAYQIFAGSRLDFPSKTKFVYKELGPALKGAKEGEYVASAPIYYKDEKIVVLPENMVYVNPRTMEMLRISAFSELTIENNKVSFGQDVLSGFLFDGKGTYVFLEPMSITIQNKEYHLAPLSMIMVSSNHMFCLYDYTTQQIIFDQNASDELLVSGQDFQIELQSDVLYNSRKERILLFEKPELLDEFK